MTDQEHQPELQPLEPHWEADWVDNGSANILPWWVAAMWLLFLLWGVIYIIDQSSAW
jgi:hypothetical protein